MINEEDISTQYTFPDDMGSSYHGVLIKFDVESTDYPNWEVEAEAKGNAIRNEIINMQKYIKELEHEVNEFIACGNQIELEELQRKFG